MFVRGALVNSGRDMGNAGYAGFYWSSVSLYNYSAYILNFNPDYVSPSKSQFVNQDDGYSLRCVALGG